MKWYSNGNITLFRKDKMMIYGIIVVNQGECVHALVVFFATTSDDAEWSATSLGQVTR